jgi:hypothetical protein
MAKRPDMIRRHNAVEKTMRRFGGRAFGIGSVDCIKMARFHLKEMGHKLPSTGNYKTVAGAVAQLKKQGVRNVAELLDKFLERIPPAAMTLGDLAMPPSEPDAPASKLGTVIIMASGQKFIGWHPDHDNLAVMNVSQIDAAWRA